ncbi:MAG: hybrid sensor histidine kinase/response regulator [Mariprofundus sp.]|nr:hybrid sensor histidine kinase/response regulator [Mariprofundus sp.]
MIWLAANILLFIPRALLLRRFAQTAPGADEIQRWGWMYTAGVCASSLLWGALPWLVFDTASTFNTLFILLLLSGIIAGALGLNSLFLPSYFFCAIPIGILMCARLAIETNDFQLFTIPLILFVVIFLFFAIKYHRLMYQSIHRQFENTDLIHRMELKNKEVEKANMAKTRFLAAASHDLRQPHQAVGLFIESLVCLEHNPEKQMILGKTQLAYRSMSALLDQLLDISKLDTGVVNPEIATIRLQPLLQSIYLEHTAIAEQKGLSLRLRPTPAIVRTDPAMLKRMIGNLLSNAVSYTSEGGVLLGVRRHAGVWRIQVWDTGCGIPANQIESIFDEFTQLHNPERDRKKGLGLGLAIVKRMEHLINAPVSVHSRFGKGSLFAIDLEPGSESAVVADAAAYQQDVSLSDKTLVVIDDDKIVRESLQTLLIAWGCQGVFSFSSGDEALASMREEALNSRAIPDAIIADYRLADNCTGVEAIHALHALYHVDIPALIITGDTAPDRMKEAGKSGFPVLHKPVEPDDLKRFLGSLPVKKG